MWGPEDQGRDCWTAGAVVGASHAQRGNSSEERRRIDKRFLGAPGGKD